MLDFFFQPESDPATYAEAVKEIVLLNEELRSFWSASHGWAPADAANLLSRARLDRQVALSRCLSMWEEPGPDEETEGRLILAWANLGSLVEGSMKLFLCVFLNDYSADPPPKPGDPDGLQLESLKQFFAAKVWIIPGEADRWLPWVSKVQNRRNAIHSFKDRELGTFDEFWGDVREYLDFVRELGGGLPYP